MLSIDVANSTRVTYPTNATTVLRFDVDLEFSDGSTYYVLLDSGTSTILYDMQYKALIHVCV